jgi:hypothetical protein
MRKTTHLRPSILNAAIFVLLFATAESVKAQAKVKSVYSDLSESKCRTIEVDKETGITTQRCPRIAGYKLLVLDDDARQSITVLTPDGKHHPIGFLGCHHQCVFQHWK